MEIVLKKDFWRRGPQQDTSGGLDMQRKFECLVRYAQSLR